MEETATTICMEAPPLVKNTAAAGATTMAQQAASSSEERRIGSSEDGGKTKKQVSFSDLSVRHFDVTCIGIVSCGPSIGLDWTYSDDRDSQSLDAYEQARAARRKQQGEKGLRLSPLQRKNILIEKHGYSPEDLMAVYQKRIDASRRWANPNTTPPAAKRRSSSLATFSSLQSYPSTLQEKDDKLVSSITTEPSAPSADGREDVVFPPPSLITSS
jgi:hypothetical protein